MKGEKFRNKQVARMSIVIEYEKGAIDYVEVSTEFMTLELLKKIGASIDLCQECERLHTGGCRSCIIKKMKED